MVREHPTREVVKMLRAAGFVPARTVGSHTRWQNGRIGVTVPDGHRTISAGVMRSILKALKEAENQ